MPPFLFAALHKAGRHMEDSIVAAYLALLIGCVLQDTSVSAQHLISTSHTTPVWCSVAKTYLIQSIILYFGKV